MNKLTYGKSWFRWYGRITDVWNAEQARQAHEKRKPYVALVEKEDGSKCVVEVNNDYFGIEFLDEAYRSGTSLQFIEREPGRLFLAMAVVRDFEGSTKEVTDATVYYFQQDGTVSIDKGNLVADEVWTTKTTIDPSKNWVPYPEFGQYDPLINFDF